MPRPPFRRTILPVVLVASLLGCAPTRPDADARDGYRASESATAALLEAEALLAAGRTDEAVDAYLAAARRSQDPALLGRAAAVAVASGRGEEARELVDRWVEMSPDEASAHARRAVLAFEARDIEVAVASLARVRALSGPANAAGLLVDGDPAARAQRVMAAHAAAFPDDRVAWFALATAAWRSSDLKTASVAIARARAYDPKWLDALLLETRIKVRRDRDPAALAELDARVALGDARPALRLVAALLRAECGDLAGARAAIEREVARDPESADARLAFASVAVAQGDLDAAAVTLRPASQDPERDDVRLELGRIAEQQGAASDALLWYRDVARDEHAVAAAGGIARVLAKAEGLQAGLDFLHAARDGQPAWAVRLARLEVQLLRDAGDDRAALAVLDAAIRATPDPDLRYLRALVAADLDDHAAAARELRALLKQTPDDPSLLNALGYTLADSDRELAEAQRLLDAALAASPDEAAILDSYGWLRYRRGDAAAARGFLERAYRYDDDAEIAAHLGEVLWTLGERAAASKLWAEAAAREPQHRVLAATRERFER
jgi:tetratricopeptide (TPR) repeat protein